MPDETPLPRTSTRTGISPELFQRIGSILTELPDSFTPHPTLEKRFLARRREAFREGGLLDWAMAESLAWGSLLTENHTVRLSGQDCQRGTFSQRHAVLHDFNNGSLYTPLEKLNHGTTAFRIYNSSLSEASVLGFEYGYALESPDALVMWEAQFGDFSNGAQVIVDQFIAAAEAKWNQKNRMVLLLPHGYEGAGSEHSSARMERYLQLCADDNMQVINPTTPAQYFHALRRQVHPERAQTPDYFHAQKPALPSGGRLPAPGIPGLHPFPRSAAGSGYSRAGPGHARRLLYRENLL